MYFCNGCENRFNDPKTEKEFIGERGHGGWVEYEICPLCGDCDFDELIPCEQCSDLKVKDGEKYCNECKEEVNRDIVEGIAGLFERYDKELVKQVLTEWVERDG